MTVRCLVVGVGKMGLAHLQALVALQPDAVAGWAPSDRRRASVETAGARFLQGSLDDAFAGFAPTHLIIASPVETLAPIAMQAMTAGVRNLLVEKPAALDSAEGEMLAEAVTAYGANLYVGYNRRFYTSIRTALREIAVAGEQIESVWFEFNEVVADAAGPVGHATRVRERWLLANSLHVIDSALFPVGHPDPARSSFARRGRMGWHSSGRIFMGAGTTVNDVAFAYHANWGAPGRWGFEWMTPSTRYVFRPLEKLSVMRRGSFVLEELPLDDELDRLFKPGVYLQDQAFLRGDEPEGLVSLEHALSLIRLGEEMAGYGSFESQPQIGRSSKTG